MADGERIEQARSGRCQIADEGDDGGVEFSRGIDVDGVTSIKPSDTEVRHFALGECRLIGEALFALAHDEQ
jgi:hypothetical protein